MTFKIYIASHKPSATIDDPNFVRIHVGAANSLLDLGEALRDDCGDNISTKNDSYCELTALYWVWKNAPQSTHVGFTHYRRHFNFNPQNRKSENEWGVLDYAKFDKVYLGDCSLNSAGAEQILKSADIVLPTKWDVRKAGSKNMRDHFARGNHHAIGDYDMALDVLRKLFPSFKSSIKQVEESHTGYFTNMFVMRWEFFSEYCEWLFGLLLEIEKRVDVSNYDTQRKRFFGFMSEWLFNVYLVNRCKRGTKINIVEIPRTFLQNTNAPKKMAVPKCVVPAFKPAKSVPIVFAFDNKFAPYASALLASIVENSNKSRNFDLIVFSADITVANKLRLRGMLAGYKNFSLRFVNVEEHFKTWKMPVYGQFSKETYYRLKIPDILVDYGKVLYLDADTVALSDLALLYDLELDGKAVGATRDVVMSGFCRLKTPSKKECGGLPAKEYLQSYLGLKNSTSYFQAGVMVFDIRALKELNFSKKVEDIIHSKQFWFLDQDILNIALEGHVKFLDGRWNALFGNGDFDTFFAYLDDKDRFDFYSALANPHILHFAGDKKPWLRPDVSFNEVFWKFARQTPFYEELLTKLNWQQHFQPSSNAKRIWNFFDNQARYILKQLGIQGS